MIALTGSALAADLPSYKSPPPPPLPPPPLWSGFYVGLNAGGTWASSNNVTTTAFPIFNNAGLGCGNLNECPISSALAASSVIGSNNNGGFIGGGQIGYNWQFWGGKLVAGVETDIQGIAYSNNKASGFGVSGPVTNFGAFQYFSITQASKSLDYIGTVRGRLGWLFTPTLLAYGTGGLAYGGVSTSVSVFESLVPPALTAPFFGASSFSDTRVGWTAGGGLEWMFMPNWSAKVEYLYYDLGTVNTSFVMVQTNNTGTNFLANALQSRARFNGNIVRAGVNYHFNWGNAPIVAKY
jgi:outer membrane immunogenic protein